MRILFFSLVFARFVAQSIRRAIFNQLIQTPVTAAPLQDVEEKYGKRAAAMPVCFQLYFFKKKLLFNLIFLFSK